MTLRLSSDSFTDKPTSLSVKDYLIRKMAVKMMVSEKTIETVVNHQFQSANEALASSKSLEISGFGKFYFNQKKAEKFLKKLEMIKDALEKRLEDPNLSPARRYMAEFKLRITSDAIVDLKPRLYDISDLRGLEEQSSTTQGTEGADQENQQREIGNL